MEFELIRKYFDRAQRSAAEVTDIALGIGDDCALLRPRPGCVSAITTDTLVAGRHFPHGTAARAIGWKSLAVNLSDLAAMGAQPQAFLLALTLPEADAGWLADFSEGLYALAAEADIALIGGDTTRGPLSITITAIGQVSERAALRRSGARAGDLVCVTGTLGDAALALRLLSAKSESDGWMAAQAALLARLDYPAPRNSEGLALLGHASAAIDLSDGLAGDLGHILAASGVGADIDIARLPMSEAFAKTHPAADRLQLQAAGGDDYELCVCVPAGRLPAAQAALSIALTPVGRINERAGLRWLDADGRAIDLQPQAYDHFR